MLGYNKIILKSNNEPAIVALKQAIKTERSEEIIMEESPVGESASNGEIENAIKRIDGQFRAMKSSLEERLGQKLARDHCAVPWLSVRRKQLIDTLLVAMEGQIIKGERARNLEVR